MDTQRVLIISLITTLVLLALLVLGRGAFLSASLGGSGPSSCRQLCRESCQGFTSAGDADACRAECTGLCADSTSQE